MLSLPPEMGALAHVQLVDLSFNGLLRDGESTLAGLPQLVCCKQLDLRDCNPYDEPGPIR